jgi:hypothetical protein
MVIFRRIFPKTINVYINIVEKIKIHILFLVTFSKNRAVYERTWKNMLDSDKPKIQYNTAHAYCMLNM